MKNTALINFTYLADSELDIVSYLMVLIIDSEANGVSGRSKGGWTAVDHEKMSTMLKISQSTVQPRLVELMSGGWLELSQDKRMYRSSIKWLELQEDTVIVSPRGENIVPVESGVIDIVDPSVSDGSDYVPVTVAHKNLKKEEVVQEADRIVNLFIQARMEVQPAYILANESKERFSFRIEYARSGRTAAQLHALIRWLYSKDKEALFWRDTISTPVGLIKHYNSVEMKYISSSKETKMMESKSKEYVYWEKKGLSHDQILSKMKV